MGSRRRRKRLRRSARGLTLPGWVTFLLLFLIVFFFLLFCVFGRCFDGCAVFCLGTVLGIFVFFVAGVFLFVFVVGGVSGELFFFVVLFAVGFVQFFLFFCRFGLILFICSNLWFFVFFFLWFGLVSFRFVFRRPPLDGTSHSIAREGMGGLFWYHGSPVVVWPPCEALHPLPSAFPPTPTPTASHSAAGPAIRSLRSPDVLATNWHLLEHAFAVASVRGRPVARACQGPRLGQRAGGACLPSLYSVFFFDVREPRPFVVFRATKPG